MALAVQVPDAAAAAGFAYPVGGLARVFRHFTARGLPAGALLEGTGLSVDDLQHGSRLIDAWQEYAFARNLLRLTGDAACGLEAGACYRLGSFGVLGTAAASCETAGEALALFLQYIDLSFTQFSVRLRTDGDDWVRIRFEDRYPLGDLRDYFLDRDMACAITIVRDSIGLGAGASRRGRDDRPVEGIRVCTTRQPLAWFEACRRVTGVLPEAGSAVDEVCVHRDLLATPLPLANPLQRRMLEQQCREESWQRRHPPASACTRVWQVLSAAGERVPSIEETARVLAMSERTLRRRLTAEGSGYQQVVDRFREARARELLVGSRDAVERIADRLGYAEASAFIHAFRRWTGTTPGAFRARA